MSSPLEREATLATDAATGATVTIAATGATAATGVSVALAVTGARDATLESCYRV